MIEGDNSSVLSTLQGAAARDAWGRRPRHYPPRDEADVFLESAAWRVDQMRRMGEALAALEPITYDWEHVGTKNSPDWLRHVVTLWLGHGRPAQPMAVLLALAEEAGQGAATTLDIVFGGEIGRWRTTAWVDRLEGAAEWLAEAPDAVRAALPKLGADARAELAGAIGRFKLHPLYLGMLLEIATGSSKKARNAGRQALTGADASSLADALRVEFGAASPARQADLVEVAAGLGETAGPLLAEWRAGGASGKARAALDRVAMTATSAAPVEAQPRSSGRIDGPLGYWAVDGAWVELPPLEPPPEPGPPPPEALRLLEPAMAHFNRLLADGKKEAEAGVRWHWTRQFSQKGPRDLDRLAALAGGTQRIRPQQDVPTVDWLRFHLFKHPAVAEFLNDPRLSLHHVVRLGVTLTNGHISALVGEWSGGEVGSAVQRRLAQGADVRTLHALWLSAGGHDHIKEHLTRRWYGPLAELQAPIWPVLCQNFAQLDEAMGLVPQSGGEAMQRLPALDLLAMFPVLPERYRGALMLLAGDGSKRLRDGARALLRGVPGLGDAIALQLQDGRQEVRALAADWLASRGEADQVAALNKALAKERSDLARAAMITALERLGEDVSGFFDPAALAAEAQVGLAKARPKGLEWLPLDRLPALRWRDGAPVDPALPQWWVVLAAKLKQPGGNALLNLWLDRLAPEDAHRLGWMVLTGWIDEDSRTPTDEEANAYAVQHVDATLQQNLAYLKQYPGSGDYWITDRAALFARLKRDKASAYLGSAVESKGVLAVATRVQGADAAQRVRAFLKDHGSRVSQAKALLDLLAAIGSGPALQLLLSAANRSKQRSVQSHAASLVEQVAERNGWSAAQLADRTIPTGGFDGDGGQELECGENRRYRLQLDAQDAIVILNAEGREVKALPGPRMDEERPSVDAAKKQLATARKEVKQVLAAQTERLQEAMCLQRGWTRGEWESFVAGHPIVGRLAARLVWRGLDGDGRELAVFRPLGDGSHTDAVDGEVDLAPIAEVRLAHSSGLESEAVAAWRAHLADYAVAPPFDQFGRDLPKLAEGQGRARTIQDREGWMIESFKLRGAAAKLGYQRGQAQDGGWFLTYEKSYREAGLVAEIEFTGSPLPEENRQTALQTLSFRKLRGTGGVGEQVVLADVPPVLLAECWRDLHDVADKGTGFDSDWRNKAYM